MYWLFARPTPPSKRGVEYQGADHACRGQVLGVRIEVDRHASAPVNRAEVISEQISARCSWLRGQVEQQGDQGIAGTSP